MRPSEHVGIVRQTSAIASDVNAVMKRCDMASLPHVIDKVLIALRIIESCPPRHIMVSRNDEYSLVDGTQSPKLLEESVKHRESAFITRDGDVSTHHDCIERPVVAIQTI